MAKTESIKVMAEFSGVTNSLGFKKGQTYALTIHKPKGYPPFDIIIYQTHGNAVVPYSGGILTFLENWTNIKKRNHQ
jgi:hypothetical protein